MLVLQNKEIREVLTMDVCLGALEESYWNLIGRQAGYRARIDLYAPCDKEDRYYRWQSMEGADSQKGYFAIRMKSDIMYWVEGKTKTQKRFCVEPGTYCDLVFLFSTRNGEPLAILQGWYLQHMRVGGCAGLAAKYLSRHDSSVVGIIGSGGMARSYLEAFFKVRQISEVRAYSPTRSHLDAYCEEMSESLGIPVIAVDSPERVFKGADIVATCTNSIQPVVSTSWLEPGMHFTIVQDQEVPRDIVDRCDVIFKMGDSSLSQCDDTTGMMAFRGQFASVFIGTPEQLKRIPAISSIKPTSYPALTQLMAGKVKGRTDDRQITFFMNQGTQGLQFASVGGKVYELARARGLGMEIPSHWFLEDIRDSGG